MKLLLGALGVGALVLAGVGIANYVRENQISVSYCADDDEEECDDEVSEEESADETQAKEHFSVAQLAGRLVGVAD